MSFKRSIFTPEHEQFRDSFKRFLQKEVVPHQQAWGEAGIIPKDIWLKCGENGFLVPTADEQYGGLGLNDYRYEAIMTEELAYINESGLVLALHNSMVAPYILNYGNDEQKARFIPRIVSGDNGILAIAMTEPSAGSDLAGMKTHAKDMGDYWLLNGSKIFITNGNNADIIIVAAKSDPTSPHSMGLFIVERGMEGFSRGKPLKKMGMKAQDTSELFFENVIIPKENLLGDPSKGFVYMMQKLGAERLSLCIETIAGAERALEDTLAYVKERKAFGKSIGKFQNTQFKLAELQTEINLGRVYTDKMIEAFNDGELDDATVCGAKFWLTDMRCKVIDECLQFFGGYGYMQEYPICKMYLDARIGKIYAGSNEIMKGFVAKSMGL